MRRVQFGAGEYYHIYNRGTEKRIIFQDTKDYQRFLNSLFLCNSMKQYGGLHVQMLPKYQKLRNQVSKSSHDDRLVDVVAYCLNPNHYHLLLREKTEGGISQFIKRVAGGYVKYFNEKYKRSGSLFQGPFKAVHVDTDRYLQHVGVYVNLNNFAHGYSESVRAKTKSSLDEYFASVDEPICSGQDIIIGSVNSLGEYKKRHHATLQKIQERKAEQAKGEWAQVCID